MLGRSLIILMISTFLLSCSSKEKLDISTPEGLFKMAERYQKDERFEEALSMYSEVKNKHPYSRYATEAELKIADVQFVRESYPEAEGSYKLFKEFHPKYKRIDYVTYRLGMSFFKQLPSTIDRDLALADNAILYFDEVVNSYPNSQYAAKAQKFKKKSLKMLAEKEDYIGNFYFIRDHFKSALGRYEELLKKYPNLGFNKRALYRAAVSAYRIKELETARKYYLELAKNFPKSKEKELAEKELSHGI